MTSKPAYLTEMAVSWIGWSRRRGTEATARGHVAVGEGSERASGRKAGKREGRSRLARRMAAAAADEEEGVTGFH